MNKQLSLRDCNSEDTIVAIATFPAKSALGVIKISGKKALRIAEKVFISKSKKNIRKAKTFTLHYGWIVDQIKVKNKKKLKKEIIDEVILSLMLSPHSYTREDVVEISSHGGVAVLNKILKTILKHQARLALPGEFTYRALINKRIDIFQAEGILSLTEAKSEDALGLACSQLRGEVTPRMEILKLKLKNFFVETESYINFPENESTLSFPEIIKRLNNLKDDLIEILQEAKKTKVLNEGLKCVICGRSNVGKSTLFNQLLREERVIVSHYSGTTRDVVEESINIEGLTLRIFDTAGILEPKDLIGRKTLEKTLNIFEEADLVILVLDGSRKINKDDLFLLEKAEGKDIVVVINKIDLPLLLNVKRIKDIKAKVVKMSALKNIGLKSFEKAIGKIVHKGVISRENAIFISNYQRHILEEMINRLDEAKKSLGQGQTLDFINLFLKDCISDLAKFTGEISCEEVLEDIFGRFCIGK